MIEEVLVDAGPLVALVNPRDQWHEWVRSKFAEMAPPLRTCEAALSEACFLARRARGGVDAILGLVERGVVRLDWAIEGHFAAVARLMRRYENIPMSLADACLVQMSEVAARGVIFTLDQDFQVYRRHGRQKIAVVAPEGE